MTIPFSGQDDLRQLGLPELSGLASDHSFVDVLEAFLKAGTSGSLQKLWKPSDILMRRHLLHFRVCFPEPTAEIAIEIGDEKKGWGYLQAKYGMSIVKMPGSNTDDIKKLNKIFRNLGITRDGDMSGWREITHRTILNLAHAFNEDP